MTPAGDARVQLCAAEREPHPALLPTPPQTAGPYLAVGFTPLQVTSLVDADFPGAIHLVGSVLDGHGHPVLDAAVEIFQADAKGRFAPECDPVWTGFGRCLTSPTGGFDFVTVKPGPPACPARAPLAPAVDVLVHARGLLRPVRTRLYFPDELASNALDPILRAIDDPARRATLVARPAPSGYRFDIHLQESPGAEETVFFAC